MKTKATVMVMISVLVLFGVSASAADSGGFDAGTWEFTLLGSGSSDDDFDATAVSAEAGIGYFVWDNMELLLRQGTYYLDSPEDDVWNGTTRVGLDLHFGFDYINPFVGASVGYIYGDLVEDQFIAGPEAGLKIKAGENAFLFALVEYEFLFEDVDEADEQFEDGRYVYSLGIGFTF